MMTKTKSNSPGSDELTELLEMTDPEDFLDWLGVDFLVTRGRSGVQLNIKECPRCGGRDRKVYLNAETGLGNCFHGTCVDNPGFNLFSFSKAFFGDSAKEAIAQLKQYASTVGWKPKKPKPLSVDVSSQDGVILPESQALPIDGKNLAYLQARGITGELVEKLGWRHCKSGHFVYTRPDGNSGKQDYSNRVIIPVFDLEGKIRTFQGRDTTGTAENKYLFPPGLAGTGQFLYNAHNAINAQTIVLCEGAFDVASTLSAVSDDHTQSIGVVGTFGKRVSMSEQGSDDQLSQLYALREAGARRFVFLWDGEFAALDDACKEAQQLRRYGFDTYIGVLPEDKDPNEVSASVIRAAITNATPATPMKVNALRMQLRSARS
jgi:DNA primase